MVCEWRGKRKSSRFGDFPIQYKNYYFDTHSISFTRSLREETQLCIGVAEKGLHGKWGYGCSWKEICQKVPDTLVDTTYISFIMEKLCGGEGEILPFLLSLSQSQGMGLIVQNVIWHNCGEENFNA